MDGTDGYAAQEALFILLFLAFLVPELRPLSMCVMGGCLGFLRVNYPKAKIFMGDVGSYFLGYFIFGIILMSITQHPSLLFPCLSITLLFTLDATFTLVKRIVMCQRFWEAHRTHWYQRLYNLGYSHIAIFWLGVLINVVILIYTLAAHYFNSNILGFMMSLLSLSVVGLFIRLKESSASMVTDQIS